MPRKEYYSSEGPMSSSEVSPASYQRRRHEKEELHGELIKIKPPTFDGENRRGEYVGSWILGRESIYSYINIHLILKLELQYII